MLIKKNLQEFAEVVKSDAPTPGGGSVSAYASMIGSALANMVGGLTIDKKAFEKLSDDEKETMKSHQERISELMDDFGKLVDDDATSFDSVMDAFKMPKETDEEKKARSEKIQEGYKKALEVPLSTAEKSLELLELQSIYAEKGNGNAITDIGVGTMLAHVGLEGALLNVEINLSSLKDEDYRKEVTEKVKNIREKGLELKDKNMKFVDERLRG
ncbi:MAG: cyclodeaminase/cyclohydrolase family protein [Tissierellia bacterium]|nr:cyclodeaminase/cyclohydrolase family protein [Tissierellia bacterium]